MGHLNILIIERIKILLQTCPQDLVYQSAPKEWFDTRKQQTEGDSYQAKANVALGGEDGGLEQRLPNKLVACGFLQVHVF